MNRMKFVKCFLLFSLTVSTSLTGFARGPESNDSKKKPSEERESAPVLAAGCVPAKNIVFLEFNNVSTRVEAGALWWQDRANNLADYEVPKGSNSFALYAGGLWLAGTDVNGQLKAAASLFGNGVDYWAGPLDTIGTAEITEEVCDRYDDFFEITRQEVAEFVAYKNAEAAGTAADDFPDYTVPQAILDWPGNGNTSRGEDFNLAPYVNVAGDASYEPDLGDYPFYDLEGNIDCRAPRVDRSESSTRPLFGDETKWWVFNDKGNLHTETNAPSIGMEIHGQAFTFATNDEVNDMTFYNFELINRSTFTLTDTYFANYVDPDLGNSGDDYVGCDVERGLGYCYNGDEFDESVRGQNGYGSTPAAIGIDFFEGPYQDADGINNRVGIQPGQALNGLGYFDPNEFLPDTLVDNERFGMRRFVYYNNSNGNNGDPVLAIHFYNYMRGIWKNGQRMRHGGDGFNSPGVEAGIFTDFMFPGDSDPLHWGTTNSNGITQVPENQNWTEDNPGEGEDRNDASDRRFLQSAGPFTLEPGNVNDITVGVVFAQAESGGRLASVDRLFKADDKAQALFDNCFQVLNGPDAPDVRIRELDRSLVFYLTNPEVSNNVNEGYAEKDPNITTPEFLLNRKPPVFYDDSFRFQGYQVFQLAGPGISVSDIENPDLARLVFQCDIKDDVSTLINYTFDEQLQANIPVRKVQGANEGIRHSFTVTEDLFASGNNRLINYKTYYYIAIAYAYNEFKPYRQGIAPDTANPFAPAYDGQTMTYLASRKSANGGNVAPVTAIPHDIRTENKGTIQNSNYGDLVGITRVQGKGNGGRVLEMTDNSVSNLLKNRAWDSPQETVEEINYNLGSGPFSVKVVDPLEVIDGRFVFKILDETKDGSGNVMVTDTAEWKMWLEGGNEDDTVYSERVITLSNEQLLFDPNWGLSIEIGNGVVPGNPELSNNGFLDASIRFGNPDSAWLSGIPDVDFETPSNWILSGNANMSSTGTFNDYTNGAGDPLDPNEAYEEIIGGTWAPYRLTRYASTGSPNEVNAPAQTKLSVDNSNLSYLNSVFIHITPDKSKWTRCPVIETSGGANKNQIKQKLSIDKNGNPVDTTGYGDSSLAIIDTALASSNPEDPGYISAIGMGWFPGYAINIETGERLNMAYGEDSQFSFDNGADMIWNPNSTIIDGVSQTNYIWGGKHYIYVFRKSLPEEPLPAIFRMPEYDYGVKLKEILSRNSDIQRSFGWRACSWVGLPVLAPRQNLLSTDVKIRINVSRPFGVKESNPSNPAYENEGRPTYVFETKGFAVQKDQNQVLKDVLEDINVVPNPYYAISEYERTQLDNVVKFVNLPQNCNIKIYNVNGTLIRSYTKADPLSYLDWDLNNQVGIPVSSGVYIIHIDVPGVGEKILKWFGVMRPVDLNNF